MPAEVDLPRLGHPPSKGSTTRVVKMTKNNRYFTEKFFEGYIFRPTSPVTRLGRWRDTTVSGVDQARSRDVTAYRLVSAASAP